MILKIAYTLILGLPIVAYLGMLALLSLFSTATIGYLNFKGNTKIPFKWHLRLAKLTIFLALVHALFALSAYLGF
ncbi:MAG: hypothetical protein A2359_03460 [Candidatus Moranbacteria bacterium RIFOXYB1_FULL_43_19]|nr:MAG: hypothetical protein A2359_03460 [Candidatus Moranbacteria bacterium RIFOXYB1_FULL_43_19]OGI27915.1 MAG: hypothetical protein A2184_02780 [Candidatus Moranbacteria bacterium RIFOXYA1_FULL_44_7]OGI32531.1 MAG: hypothetical protein A2420_03075 [Candidatus Moranbacteria bacterium RIFOXYC1_FULL_44_13]OGI38153.1 MAG: hypothetical protein A2612_01365 [Candidatus Moranbacteria bacterium RIFOXYD1_FULL_44_12]